MTLPEPYYADDSVTLYQGDCREILPHLFRLGKVGATITDPPYNAGIAYKTHDDRMAREEYQRWCESWFWPCRENSKRMVVFPGHGNLPIWWNIEKPSGTGCWYKPGNPAGGGVVNFCEWEPWLYWGPFLGGSDTIRATVSKQPDTGDHPCPKPLSLMRALVGRMRSEDILDPFAGSGSTLRAAKDLGVRAVGIEIDPDYCRIIESRLRQEVLDVGA